jgi:hypothetical protein
VKRNRNSICSRPPRRKFIGTSQSALWASLSNFENMFQSQWKAPSNGSTVAQVCTVIYASAEVRNQLMSPFVAECEREYLCCGSFSLSSRAIHICRDNARAKRSPKSLNFHKVIAWNVEFFYVPLSRLDAAVIGCFLSLFPTSTFRPSSSSSSPKSYGIL